MIRQSRTSRSWNRRLAHVVPALLVAALATTAMALPPVPLNDTPATAENVGATFPVLIYGATVIANDDVSTTAGAVPALDTVIDGPDVFYRIEPVVHGTYRFQVAPWQYAPLRSSERRFALYMMEDLGGGSFAVMPGQGVRAGGSARAVILDVALLAGGKYVLGIDQDAATHDESDFTLAIDLLTLTNPDNCGSAEVLPSTLPVVRMNNIDGAAHDFNFTQSTDQCAIVGSTPAVGNGNDHVYQFTPNTDGYYAIELISDGYNPMIYIDDACPPLFVDGCQGASDHNTGGTSGGRHEFIVVFLFAATPYYIYVDQVTAAAGAYTLIIDDAVNYGVTEEEPNGTPASASLPSLPISGGQIAGPGDVDYWAITGNVGDRVYAWAHNGGTANSFTDNELRFYAADGSTLIEYDDDDGEGAGASGTIDLYYFVTSTTSAAIAGAKLTSNGTHYLEVSIPTATGTQHKYRMHIGVEPADRTPQAELEPNNDIAHATVSGLNYFSGVGLTGDDEDWYAFTAQAGDHVYVAFDGDPERDSSGTLSAGSDSLAYHARLSVYDPDNDPLLVDSADSNTSQTGGGDYPAQNMYFVAPEDGLYKVRVRPQGTLATAVGPTETYHLAIFLNGEPPFLAEYNAPDVVVTADFANEIVNGTATDNEPGDTGICSVELINTNNVMLTNLSFTPGDPEVTFTVELEDGSTNGSGTILVTDCAGNTTLTPVAIDVSAPLCTGFNFSKRAPDYLGDPIHVPNNDVNGTTNAMIEIPDAGTIIDVNVTVSMDSIDLFDVELNLISPAGTNVELVSNRMSSLAFNMRDATFDDSAGEILPISSSDEPYTGSWLPEDPAGLAKLIGESAQGAWKLRAADDSSSEDFGQTLVAWSLDVTATFAGPEQYSGSVADLGDGGGIMSIALTSSSNTVLEVDPGFVPGDQTATFLVSLIDPLQNGTAEVTVTDFQDNTCVSVINLNGHPDVTPPQNSGSATTELTFKSEVQQLVPNANLVGITDTINVPVSFMVGEVEVALMVDSRDQGRNALKLTHNGEEAILVNRIGMDERDSVGNTKGSFDVYLDDDAPAADDIHLEPALGTQEAVGLYQPDGRGDFYGNGITSDPRDHMLFRLSGLDAAGAWDLNIIDARFIGTTTTYLRRWALTLKSPCGAERYVGTAMDLPPGTGIFDIDLAAGATNLAVVASFVPGDPIVQYRVDLVDDSQPGSGTLEITDGVGNVTSVPVALAPSTGDVNLPDLAGAYNVGSAQFEGTATDNQPGDTGVVAIDLAPYSDNLTIVSSGPAGPGAMDFVVGLVNPAANGRGYIRATDGCGNRGYLLVEIDALAPICTGTIDQTRRYFSGPVFTPLPDNNAAGVTSDIIVSDTDDIADVDITFNITHGFDDDIDLTLTSPAFVGLISDRGSTGNDFIDTTLDDEAAAVLPDSSASAPFTGSFQPADGLLSTLDGLTAAGTFTLKAVDDKVNDFGSFDHWSLRITSDSFVEEYDGRAEDSAVYDSGICSIGLLAVDNVALTIDPSFTPGDKIVRYTVDLVDQRFDGSAVVRVVDCAGNACEVPIALRGVCLFADLDGDDDIDADDYQMFRAAYGRTIGDPQYNPLADFDGSGAVGLSDFQEWLRCYRDFINNPFAAPPVSSGGQQGSVDGVKGPRPGQLAPQTDPSLP